ncbi:MAG: hypothetical protein KJZ52_03585 [Anaerolineales bacterium]|nr:hypothetical protein [Anaerolineales bacterium]
MPFNRQRFIKYALQFAGWTLLFFLLTETFVRFAFVSSPTLSSKVNGGGMEIYGFEGYGFIYYLPNLEIATPFSGSENIVTLGDSYTQARHLLYWKNYSSVAEKTLRSQGYIKDIRNFGYMATAIPYQIGIGKSLMETYHPRVVVIELALNDFISDRAFDKTAPFYFQIDAAGNLILKSLPEQVDNYLKLPARLENKPAFSFYSRLSIESYLKTVRGQKTGKPDVETEQRSTDEINLNTTQNPNPKKSKAAQDKILSQIFALIEDAYGETPIVFIFRPSFSKKDNQFYYDKDAKRIISLLSQHPNWHTMCIADPFNSSFQNGYSPIGFGNTDPFSGHWNINGHKIVGNLLAENLISMMEIRPITTAACNF